MNANLYQVAASVVVTLGVGVALVVSSFGSVSNAEARVTGPRDTSMEYRCGMLQDEFDKWFNRYVAAPAGSPGEAKAYQMMGNMENAWADINLSLIHI